MANAGTNPRSYSDKLKGKAPEPDVTIEPVGEETSLAVREAVSLGLAGIAGPMTAGMADEILNNSKDWDVAPVYIRLEPGMYVRGNLVGEGAIETKDLSTGELKPLRTWILEDERGVRGMIASTYQLDRDLQNHERVQEPVLDRDGKPALKANGQPIMATRTVSTPRYGEYVQICRLENELTKDRKQVARYTIAFRKTGPAGTGKAG